MRIVIDLQLAQNNMSLGEGLSEGIFSFVKDLESSKGIEVIISLNGLFSAETIAIRKAFKGIVKAEKIHTWMPPELPPGSPWHRSVAQLVREASMYACAPSIVLVLGEPSGNTGKLIYSSGSFSTSALTLIAQSAIDKIGVDSGNSPMIANDLLLLDHYSTESLDDIICLCKDELSHTNENKLESKDTLPKLAMVTPIPPEKSGIAFYAAELIPVLSQYYDIDVVVDQERATDTLINESCRILTAQDFLKEKRAYERVIYHFGNSHFHAYMFDLLEKVPGVVVLHDLYLGDLNYYQEWHLMNPGWYSNELYLSHGYKSVENYTCDHDIHTSIKNDPGSYKIFKNASNVIVHSVFAKELALKNYPNYQSDNCHVVPLLRQPAVLGRRDKARDTLGIDSEDYVVCSFGLLGQHKLNSQIIAAWISSSLEIEDSCKLVFVGELAKDDYGDALLKLIGERTDIVITGWVDDVTYKNYLSAADAAVQLRSESRGETSAAVLDCLNYGLATIVNACGSMVELAGDGVILLNHEKDSDELVIDLVGALNKLWLDDEVRHRLSQEAETVIRSKHSPEVCAQQYKEVIEKNLITSSCGLGVLVNKINELGHVDINNDEKKDIAIRLAKSLPLTSPNRKIFVDVTITAEDDLRTGIQRVVRSIVREFIDKNKDDFRVEPVYLSCEGGPWHYRYARRWTSDTIINSTGDWAVDEPIEHSPGDILLVADFLSGMLPSIMSAGVYDELRKFGVETKIIVYDLLPITQPTKFPPEAELNHRNWLNSALKFDGAICISESVADELKFWVSEHSTVDLNSYAIDWFHLGADISASAPTKGLPADHLEVTKQLENNLSFLMVGTIEPRKGHAQTLDAFNSLWANGLDINLTIVGKVGWDMESFIDLVKLHPEYNARLIWLDSISDEYLDKIYEASDCLIAASEGEGFGLPLIEAARHKIPIIARDIPVFREVSAGHAYYFDREASPRELRKRIVEWINLYEKSEHPSSIKMPFLTWKESAKALLEEIV